MLIACEGARRMKNNQLVTKTTTAIAAAAAGADNNRQQYFGIENKQRSAFEMLIVVAIYRTKSSIHMQM